MLDIPNRVVLEAGGRKFQVSASIVSIKEHGLLKVYLKNIEIQQETRLANLNDGNKGSGLDQHGGGSMVAQQKEKKRLGVRKGANV